MSMSAMMAAGGPIVLLLLVLSAVSLALIVAKAVQIVGVARGRSTRLEAARAWAESGGSAAVSDAGAFAGPVGRVFEAAVSDPAAPASTRHARAERVARGELAGLRSTLRLLEVIAVVSPLLGLLGTVTGLIEAFQALEQAGGGANASVLSGGIWQALLTTAMGLIVAIPAAAAGNLLDARVEAAAVEMENLASVVFGETLEAP